MPSKSNTKDVAKARRKIAQPPARNPLWPLLQPVVPPSDLRLETLLQDQIIVIHNLLTSTLCKKYVSFLSSLPLTTTPAQPKEGEALRVNDRVQYDDAAFAEQIWSNTALKTLVNDMGEAKSVWGGDFCGLNPRIRIYRYGICSVASGRGCFWDEGNKAYGIMLGPGQFFGQHYDESNSITLPTDPPTPARTTWTLLIYLTGPSTGCVGGETVFYPTLSPAKKMSRKRSEATQPIIVVKPEVGMALLHKHGQDCLLHEGRTVTEGDKWVIRTDICVRK